MKTRDLIFAGALAIVATPAFARDSFADMQAKSGVATFLDACVMTLPNFADTPDVLAKLGAAQPSDLLWQLGGDALTVTVHSNSERTACIATIAQATQKDVLRTIMDQLKAREIKYRTAVHKGNPVAFIEPSGGPAAIMVIQANIGVTLMAQPKPD